MTYKYYSPRRPITPGIITGADKVLVISVENFDEPLYVPEIGRSALGCVVCSGNLSNCERYDLIEEKKYRRKLMPGDIIRSRGSECIIKKICNQNISDSYLGSTPTAECSFYDTDNKYREWYSYKDGVVVDYFDENNLYSLLDSAVMEDACSQCMEILDDSGIYSDRDLTYFVIKSGIGRAKLYRNSRYFGYVDLKKDDEQDELFKNLIDYLQDILGEDIKFFAFGSKLTGGLPVVKTELPKGLIHLSWELDEESIRVRVVEGEDISIEELNRISRCCIDEHMVFDKVEKRLSERALKCRFLNESTIELHKNNKYSKIKVTFE